MCYTIFLLLPQVSAKMIPLLLNKVEDKNKAVNELQQSLKVYEDALQGEYLAGGSLLCVISRIISNDCHSVTFH